MKRIFTLILLISIVTFSSTPLFGQNSVTPGDNKYELGISNAPVYFIGEKEFAYGLHFHLTRAITNTRFGFGLGYEHIFAEHRHTTIGIVASYSPVDRLTVNLAPGVTFEGDHKDELNFAAHLEASYEFEIGNFHFGPAAEIAYDPEDIHLSLGIHVGIGF